MQVSRALLKATGRTAPRADRLCIRDCAVLCWVHFRADRKERVGTFELKERLDGDRSTAWRALKRLRARGWLDASNRPARPLPKAGKGGYIELAFSAAHEHGVWHALLLRQLLTLHEVDKARTDDHLTTVPLGLLASMTGRHRDTVRSGLDALELGHTAKIRLLERRHKRGVAPQPVRAPLIRRTPHESPAELRSVVRFVSERERQQVRATTRAGHTLNLTEHEQRALVSGSEHVLASLKRPTPPVRLPC